MPPVVDASTPARTTITTAALTITSAAFNPPALSVVVVIASFDGGVGINQTISISNNGAATTWVPIGQRNDADAGGQPGCVAAFLTVLTAARTGMTVTVTASTSNEGSMRPYVLTSADIATPLGAVAEGSSTANTLTTTSLVSLRADSLGFISHVDSVTATAAPTSADSTFSGYFVTGSHSGGAGYRNLGAQGSSNAFTVDASGTAAAAHNWVAFEIEAAILLPPRHARRGPNYRR